jgi:hypothetical protein
MSKYAGICGFIVEEFDSLFEDRMELTLDNLKKAHEISPSAGLDDLKGQILNWYEGYNWGGKTRLLNPYSVLNFFDNNS